MNPIDFPSLDAGAARAGTAASMSVAAPAAHEGRTALESAPQGSSWLLDLSRHQRNLLLFKPLFMLDLNKGRVTDESQPLFEGIDTHYLALTALDTMMEGTAGDATGATAQYVLQRLVETATRMKPSLAPGQAGRIADAVLGALDNKANNYRKFAFEYFDAAQGAMRTALFRLVEFGADLDDVPRYRPTPEGYLVYLGMLDLSVEDSQELVEKVLSLLVERGRFDKAREIATTAARLSKQYRQQIRERLNQAYRSPGSVNWTNGIAKDLATARVHVTDRQKEDRRLEEAIREQLRQADDTRARSDLAFVLQTVQEAARVRTLLLTDITGAAEKFMLAQSQVFKARRSAALPDLEPVLLPQALAAPLQVLSAGADDFIAALYPPQFFPVFDLGHMALLLLEPQDEAGEVDHDEGEVVAAAEPTPRFDQALVQEVTSWVRQQLVGAQRLTLSTLLERGRESGKADTWRRCLVFVTLRSFASSETAFPLCATRALDAFSCDITQGNDIEFFPLEPLS